MARPRQSHPVPESSPETIGCLAALTRLAWLVGGGAALAILALLIARAGTFGSLDIAFWGTVVFMVVLRLIDITRYGGLTSNGEPATMQTWRRYLFRLLFIAGGLWGLAHIVLPHIVP